MQAGWAEGKGGGGKGWGGEGKGRGDGRIDGRDGPTPRWHETTAKTCFSGSLRTVIIVQFAQFQTEGLKFKMPEPLLMLTSKCPLKGQIS